MNDVNDVYHIIKCSKCDSNEIKSIEDNLKKRIIKEFEKSLPHPIGSTFKIGDQNYMTKYSDYKFSLKEIIFIIYSI